MNKILKNKSYFISAIIILIGFQIVYGLEIVLPSNINWIMSAYHDWGQHYLGWAYFREEPWHFPLGHIENFNYPAGTNVGYTDSIPLLALFFKLFSFALPKTFQYLGLWLLACHLLTGFYTIRILELFKAKTPYILLAVVLIAFNPVLVYRSMHPALCAHWLLLASVYYYLLKPNQNNVAAINKKQILLIILSALINPYLLLMIIGFGIVLPFRHYYFDKLLTIKKMLVYIAAPIVFVLSSWLVVGLLSFGGNVRMEVENSYGLYSFNLNSFWNSCGFSPLTPQLKTAMPQQYEGYAYLGLGIMLLLGASLLISIFPVLKSKSYRHKQLWPLVAVVFFSVLFAITNKVTYHENTLFTIKLPEIIIKFGGIFRASGRFIWILYYSLYLLAIVLWVKIKLSDKIKLPLLLALTALQLYDNKTMLTFRDLPSGGYANAKISEKTWVEITSNFKRIVTVQPFDNNLLYPSSYQDLCIMALKNKLPITCGYVARDTQDANILFKDSLMLEINEASIKKSDVFITTPAELPNFYNLINNEKVTVRFLDGFYCVYAKENKIHIDQSAIETRKIDSLFKSVKKTNQLITINQPVFSQNKIQFNLEKNSYKNDIILLNGWAIRNGATDNTNDSIYFVLTNPKKTFLFKANPTKRPDITTAKGNGKGNLDNAGFALSIYTKKLNGEKFNLGIAIKDKQNKWTYQLMENVPMFDIRKRKPPVVLKAVPKSAGTIIGNIEKIETQSGNIYIDGWAAIEKQDANNSIIRILLTNNSITYEIEAEKLQRPDVTANRKEPFNYDDTGFVVKLKQNQIKQGAYKIGLSITDKNNKTAVFFSDKRLVSEQ